MATNFDKWKAGLKPEDLIFHSEYYGIHEDVSMFHHEEEDCCWCCPARDTCRSSDPLKRCGERWLDWANSEADEEETK